MDARDCACVHEGARDDPSSKAPDLSAWYQNDLCAVGASIADDDDDHERGLVCCEFWYWRSMTTIRTIYRS